MTFDSSQPLLLRSADGADRARSRAAASPRALVSLLSGAAALGLPWAGLAQTPSADAAPVNPAAAAGMTTGLSGGMSSRDIELMQVRSAAHAAEGEAFAASMARSAERSLDEQNRQRTLQSAREEKAIKRTMAERMKWERASAEVNKVSANDMSTWRTESGSVRVERNLPDPFLASLIEEERQLAAREAAARANQGSGPIAATKRALSWRPFQGRETSEELTMAATAFPTEALAGRSVASVTAPAQARVEPDVSNAEPQFASASATVGSAQRPTPTPAVSQSASAASRSGVGSGRIPQISGAALVDGRSQVRSQEAASAPVAAGRSGQESAVLSQPAGVSADLPGGGDDEGGGFFSRLRPDRASSTRSGSSGGFLGFGRKRPEPVDIGGIDAGLFPSEAPSVVPSARNLGGSYTAAQVASSSEFASSSPSSVELPGAREEPERRRGLSIPRPSLSMPSLPGIGGGDSGGRGVPAMTTINSSGTDVYVVTGAAQFMVYGDDPLKSEVRALGAGTVVRMVKPGEQWASIRLPSGEEGVVQNKFLRAASASEAGGQF